MKQEYWNHIETILDTALALTAEERTIYIVDACGSDEELLTEINDILKNIEEAEETQFLEGLTSDNKQLVNELSESLTASPELLTGAKIGAFKLTEVLGSGGMGTVYKAERVEGGFFQQVAIKLLQTGIRSNHTMHRFRMEQEILATLKHASIAQLYDGGVTRDGVPYLIMEYVDGVPIDEYCDEHKLTISQRIDLFKDVCSAVQFAHANLVIHRDLKAQNIYIDTAGNVKVLDFGIAKLLEPKLSQQTLLETRLDQKLLTPQYAAPEQIDAGPITIVTDVYALGVLLHKLLTGTYPLELRDKSFIEIKRIISEEPPVKPSLSILTGTKKRQICVNKEISYNDLANSLKGDLDAVILKALRKEPEYRYNTVKQLLEDLERFTSGLPLIARRDTVPYRIGKFVRRNKAGIIAAFVVFLLITGLTSFYTYRITQEKRNAEAEAKKEEQVSRFLVNLFERANPYGEEAETGLDIKVGTILEIGSERLHSELKNQPEIRATLETVIGEVYKKLGEFGKAKNLLEDAINIFIQTNNNEELALSIYHLAHVFQETGAWGKADSLLQQSLVLYQKTPGGLTSEGALTALSLYGNLTWFNGGNYAKADSLLTKSLQLRLEYYNNDKDKLAKAYNDLAALNHSQGKFAEAEPFYRKAILMYQESPNEEINLSITMANFSILLREDGKLEEAEKLQIEALNLFQTNEAQYKVDIALGHGNLSEINYQKGNYKKADSLATISLSLLTSIYGTEHPYVAQTKLTLGKSYYQQKKYTQSEELLLQIADEYKKIYPENHPRLADPVLALGNLYLETGYLDKAEIFLEEAYQIRKSGYSHNSWRTAIAMSDYGYCLLLQENFEKADSLLTMSYEILINEFGDRDPRVLKALERLE